MTEVLFIFIRNRGETGCFVAKMATENVTVTLHNTAWAHGPTVKYDRNKCQTNTPLPPKTCGLCGSDTSEPTDVSPSHYQTSLTSTPPSALCWFFHGADQTKLKKTLVEREKKEEKTDVKDEIPGSRFNGKLWAWAISRFSTVFLRQQKRDVGHLFTEHHASSILTGARPSGQPADPSPVPLNPVFHLNEEEWVYFSNPQSFHSFNSYTSQSSHV